MIENIKFSIGKITDAPLPVIPGGPLQFYLELENIRCQGAIKICSAWLRKQDEPETSLIALESIRVKLLRMYPGCSDLLDPQTWLTRKH